MPATSATRPNTTSYIYDNLNRRRSETFPSSRTNTYVYDKNGNLKSLADANGTTSYAYDEINRLASLTSPAAASGNETINYGYSDTEGPSGAPQQRTATMPGATLTHEIDTDLAGNVIIDAIRAGSTDRFKQTNSYLVGSNTSPRVHTSTDLAGNTTTYSYGPAERLREAKTTNGSTPVEDWTYSYDAAGNRLTAVHTVGSGSPATKTFAYNQANQLCWAYAGTHSGSYPPGWSRQQLAAREDPSGCGCPRRY